MPKLRFTPKDKLKVEKLYMKGHKPSEIAAEMGCAPAQITRYVYKHGLSKQRGDIKQLIADAKVESAVAMLERVRSQTAADLEPVVMAFAESIKLDADKLKDAWNLVETASDASSLMRAKASAQSRLFEFIGAANQPMNPEPPKQVNIFMGSLPRAGDAPVNVTPVTPEPFAIPK